MKSSSKPSDSAARRTRCVANDGKGLNATAIAVLAELRRQIPAPEVSGVVINKTLVKKVGRSVRSVQLALGALVTARLICREKVDQSAEISLFKTLFVDASRVDQIVKGAKKLKKIKRKTPGECAVPKQTRSYEQRYPFAYLSDPARFQGLDVSNALIDGLAYWRWVSRAMTVVGYEGEIKFVAQKRKKSDGQRGGIVPGVGRLELVGAGSIPKLDGLAKYLEGKQMEGTFRVNEQAHPLLLVDDVGESELELLPEAAAILETSPGNFQATLVAPRSLSRDEILAVQTALIESVKGDDGANGSSQLRRFPGSINNKASLERAFVTRVHRIPESCVLSTAELEELLRIGTRSRAYMPSSRTATAPDAQDSQGTAGETNAHPSSHTGETDDSGSGMDFGRAIELFRKGVSRKQIVGEIAERAGLRRKYGRGPGDKSHLRYAEKTVKNALEKFRSPMRKSALKSP